MTSSHAVRNVERAS